MEHHISKSPRMMVLLDAIAVEPHSTAHTALRAHASMASALRIPQHQTNMGVMDANVLKGASDLDTCVTNAIP